MYYGKPQLFSRLVISIVAVCALIVGGVLADDPPKETPTALSGGGGSQQGNALPVACGDMDGDGLVSIEDVTYMMNFYFFGGPAPVDMQLSNVNCDEQTDIGDLVYLADFLYERTDHLCCDVGSENMW